MNRVCLITRGNLGKVVKETLVTHGKKNLLAQTWDISENLPPLMENDAVELPVFCDCDLVLSYALHPDINLAVIDLLKSKRSVLLMPYSKAPLPPGYHEINSLLVGVLKPCCVIPPSKNSVIQEFRQEFGAPSFSITVHDDVITQVTVVCHTRCGDADFVAKNLVGVPAEEACQKAGLLSQYYCQSSSGPRGSIHEAGKIHAEAVRKALNIEKRN
ncbi:MAG: hypothetical protein HXS52_03620 [Theionarchaea archaeon]|nr:hypothetical protein [Theionarchaea archaeon]